MNEEEKTPKFPLPLSIEESVEKGDFEKAAQSARKIFDVWSYGSSLVLAGDLWAKAGDLVRAKECYELFLLRCGRKDTISDSVRSKLSSIKISKASPPKPPSKKSHISIPKKILAALRNLFFPVIKKASDKYKISVIMTTYNSEKYVGKAIDSILSQTHSNFELIIIDDASKDSTFQILKNYANKDARVKIFKNLVNQGTYCSKNLGITYSTGKFITMHDSDDTSDNKRLEFQLRPFLKDSELKVSSCNYVRVNSAGDILINRGLKERLAIMGLMWKKTSVNSKLGYFDSVRTSADAEFYDRLRTVFSKDEFSHINRPLIKLLHREGSLTTKDEGEIDMSSVGLESSDNLDFLSEHRKEYVKSYREWHVQIKKSQKSPHMPFPLLRRRFKAPQKLRPSFEYRDEYVTASVASIPSRIKLFKKVVESILPQVDHLDVYLNGYNEIPEYLDSEKINVARSQDYGDQRDNGKFFFLSTIKKGYHFTIDDDIQYPPDYVQKNILKLEQYNLEVAVGTHGVNMAIPIENFYDNRTVYHYSKELKKDKFVNLVGTGTLAYHTSTIKLNFEDFKDPGMADVWFAIAAKKQAVPLLAIEHDNEWLVSLETGQTNLYNEFLKNDKVQTKAMKANEPWVFFEQYELYEPLATRLINTYTDSELQSRGVDVEYLQYILYLPVLKGSFGGWSISQTLFDIIHKILEPGDKILELGSGWGTGQLVKDYEVFSVEDNKNFLDIYESNYIYAPIVEEKIPQFPNDKGWYDIDVLKENLPEKYDLILVDGPWGHIGRGGFAKYLDVFRTDIPIIIDDIQREEELALVNAVVKKTEARKKIYTSPHLKSERIAKQFAVLMPY